ncbi:enoyl-CoA hydratase-related protein [uncultured Sunxiuqinia sp.]|uniref:enoyl-CoA hydratase-related protein n=1 Tax=uncultured Sunxiuqinia sp. TaxID=1573825 RepID=UPI0026241CCF|nr:enoyl-CoA hydratase-related protein [uncultured Sunxiuqinia sp.]
MKNWKNIQLEITGRRANLLLNRKKVHNALNPRMIEEMHEALAKVAADDKVQFLVISGAGKSFCAGADINWFAEAVNKAKSDNWQEYLRMAELMKVIYQFPKITITAVHRHVLGGANGIVAACDFAVAEHSTAFAFGEIKLGIVPAIITPFLSKRMSTQNLKKLMYSGDRFGAPHAHGVGLVDFLAEDGQLEQVVRELIDGLKTSSPNALRACKQLLLKEGSGELTIENSEYTAAVLAELIHSDEGQEGLRAFLEKRKPDWKKLNVVEN